MSENDSTTNESERWLPMAGFVGRYEVSNCGRVRAVTCRNQHCCRVLKPTLSVHGYLFFRAFVSGQYSTVYLARAVLVAFVGNPPTDECQVNHMDGDKTNNHVSNLEWSLPQENTNHAYASGLCTGKKIGQGEVKLTRDSAATIKSLQGVEMATSLAKRFNVSQRTILDVWQRRTWKSA